MNTNNNVGNNWFWLRIWVNFNGKYIFLVLSGLRFYCLMKDSECHHQLFFYSFRVMLEVSVCFQMDMGWQGWN